MAIQSRQALEEHRRVDTVQRAHDARHRQLTGVEALPETGQLITKEQMAEYADEFQQLETERNKLKEEFERSQSNFTAFISFFYLMFATSIVSDRESERPPQELLNQLAANSANGRRLSLVLDTLISNPVLATA